MALQIRLFIIFLTCYIPIAFAQPETHKTTQSYSASTGTGFFVNSAGYLITNAHVVEECKAIWTRGSLNSKNVKLIAVDKEKDLALLKTEERPSHTAPMRYNIGFKPGDEVMLLGYPGIAIQSGEYVIRTAKVVDTKGPPGRPDWLLFSDSAEQGNSGGPLLDGFGNVIGVVTAKLYRVSNPDVSPEAKEYVSDAAVNMPVLQRFMDKHYVTYDRLISYDELLKFRQMDIDQIETRAKQYVVGVICIQQ